VSDDGWQPIYTAPKGPLNPYSEGPRILLANHQSIALGYWKQRRVYDWRAHGEYLGFTPTHWRPLPDKPDAS
jgi:hypothetical protein